MRLNGRSAIVTGAATGLGRCIAETFAAEGAKVVMADLQSPTAQAEQIVAAGAQAFAIQADISRENEVAALVESTLSSCGSVDILVNNAAISAELTLKPFEQIDVAEWRRVFEVNVLGSFLCARAVAPYMRRQKWGRIVNFASGTAFKGSPFFLHYVASKGAIISMTRALAHELGADNILVNAIAPGFTLTENALKNPNLLSQHRAAAVSQRALKREAYPDDIVGAALFLASEDSKFVTGQILSVDGGSVYH